MRLPPHRAASTARVFAPCTIGNPMIHAAPPRRGSPFRPCPVPLRPCFRSYPRSAPSVLRSSSLLSRFFPFSSPELAIRAPTVFRAQLMAVSALSLPLPYATLKLDPRPCAAPLFQHTLSVCPPMLPAVLDLDLNPRVPLVRFAFAPRPRPLLLDLVFYRVPHRQPSLLAPVLLRPPPSHPPHSPFPPLALAQPPPSPTPHIPALVPVTARALVFPPIRRAPTAI